MISKRVQSITPSATLAMSAQAKEMIDSGIDVLNFSAGEPDFPVSQHILEAAKKSLDAGESSYSPAGGLPELRSAIAAGHGVDTDQVVVTNGGKEALYLLFQTLLDEGDEVILPSPFWVSYDEQITLALGVPVVVPTNESFHIDVATVEAAITERTRAIVLNSPANPTGAIQPQAVVDALTELAREHNVILVLDEVYQTFVYDGIEVGHPLVGSNVLVIDSVSKSHGMTGWRVGWAVGPQELITGMITLKSHLSSNTSNAMQRGALAAITGPQEDVARMQEAFTKRRQMVVEGISKIDGLSLPAPEGAFYAFIDCSTAMERMQIATATELCSRLLEEAHVALVPGEAFGEKYTTYVRFSFASSEEEIKKGLKRLNTFFI